MVTYNTKNIIVGAANVFVSTEDSTTWTEAPDLPAFTTDGTGFSDALETDAVNWKFLGFTSGGIEFTYTPDFGAVEVDQLLDDAKLFKQKMSATVATSLPEATLENIVLAWGQQGGTLVGTDEEADKTLTVSAGELGDEPVERSMAFVGPAPRTPLNKKRERVYYLERCLQVESSAHSLNRAEATMIPVSFRCLPGDSGDYGRIIDHVIVDTP